MAAWTDLMKSLLTNLWATDKPSPVIAAEMGMTKNAVIGQAHRLGLPCRKHIKTGLKKGTPIHRKPIQRKGGIHLNRLVPTSLPEYVPTVDGVPFLELRYGQCRAIIGHDDDERRFTRSCGQPTVEGGSYCPYHTRVYTNRQPQRAG